MFVKIWCLPNECRSVNKLATFANYHHFIPKFWQGVYLSEWLVNLSLIFGNICQICGVDRVCLIPLQQCIDEKPKYFSSTCCKSWLAVNVLWHKWHWNDLSSTLHDDHLCAWKTQIFFKCLLQKLTCSKWVVAQVTLEWLVFHSPWWTLVWMKNPYIFQLFVAEVDLQ